MIRLSMIAQLELVESVAALLRAGLPLRDALEGAAEGLGAAGGARCRRASGAARLMATRLSLGVSTHTAIVESIRYPDPYLLSLASVIDATAAAGTLLTRCEKHLRSKIELVRAVRSALVYPILVVVLTLIGSLAMAFIAVPMVTGLLLDTGLVEQSQAASLLRSSSRFAWTLVATMSCGIGVALISRVPSKRGGLVSRLASRGGELVLRVPLSGRLLRARELQTVLEATTAVVECGIPLDRALASGIECVGQQWMRRKLTLGLEQIRDGYQPSRVLGEVFGPFQFLLRYFDLSERGASVQESLHLMTAALAELQKRFARHLQTVLEPLAVVVSGSVLVISVMFLVRPLLMFYSQVTL